MHPYISTNLDTKSTDREPSKLSPQSGGIETRLPRVWARCRLEFALKESGAPEPFPVGKKLIVVLLLLRNRGHPG